MTDRFRLIAAEKADPRSRFGVRMMCAALRVSASGFYEWLTAPASARARRRELVAAQVQVAFTRGRGAYGVRRVHRELRRHPDPAVSSASMNLVRSLMRALDLHACQPRAYRVTTVPDPAAPAGPADLCRRDFTADAPGTKLVGDITYIRTWQGWLYLATVIDCHTKAVIGWAMADHLRTDLICDALSMAANHVPLMPGAIFHSDRGTQGGLNRSSQHLVIMEVVDGATSAAGGSGRAAGDAVPGPSDAGPPCRARVLAPDRAGQEHRGRVARDRRVGAGRVPLVSPRWRHAVVEPGRAVRPLLVVR